jgi:hypothetical protein
MDSSDDSKKNFFKYVFNFDDDSKSEILNLLQYAIIALIPVVILNKVMSKYVPEVDESKSSMELLAEIVLQVFGMFLGLLLIHRVVTFIPTYSGAKYPEYSVIYIVLAVLMITLSLQTKIGEKVDILFQRLNELWNGKDKSKTKTVNVNGKQVTVKVTQPISGQNQGNTSQTMNQAAMQQAMYTDGTSIGSLPTGDITNNSMSNQYTLSPERLPNYNNMYQKDTTPLVGAATPGINEGFMNEPMAANSVLGGGAFGSW